MNNIRNFVIIAHIDHGKSTLADRLLEVTGTVEARRMRAQYLDQLDLERERGITIKMAPVRMKYSYKNEQYILNLIDTPGHSDFSYEVSRALTAVEGAILLVDASKGIQAQTLSNLRNAQKAGLKIIGAVNKIDLNVPHLEKTIQALADLLKTPVEKIFRISGKTGKGVEELLGEVIKEVPPPAPLEKDKKIGRALIFDSLYDDHKGILAYVRIFDGSFKDSDEVRLLASGAECKLKEVGCFMPELKPAKSLSSGEIGYIATGFKEPALVRKGDTIILTGPSSEKDLRAFALPGYREAIPTVFISFYPDGQTKFEELKRGFERLRLTDAALSFEPDANDALGRGLKVGFLGQLHFEITSARLSREFNLEFLTSFPSIAYRVKVDGVEKIINEPHAFPAKADEIWEPMIRLEILTPQNYLQKVLSIQTVYDISVERVENVGENLLIIGTMPLSELIRDFDDQLKSASAGFASFSYELAGERKTDAERLDILLAGEVVPALTRIVRKSEIEREARSTVERLKSLLPKAQFSQAIQAQANGRILARETIPAMRKDVTGYLYGGDRSRKMKLWKKQKRGKEKLLERAKVNLSPEVFREILKK
ncbi:MAG: translation elongation factor 4 [Candidatus Liptonbacteria bacterium]|nr:translation elongation factor 4 [Candidatus Liptonbacteria bacterium]